MQTTKASGLYAGADLHGKNVLCSPTDENDNRDPKEEVAAGRFREDLLLPAQRVPHGCSAAAQAQGRHPVARATLRAAVAQGTALPEPQADPRRHSSATGLRLARQRP